MVECLTCDQGVAGLASPEALRFVLEQDTKYLCLVLFQPRKTRSDITEFFYWDVKNQIKQRTNK